MTAVPLTEQIDALRAHVEWAEGNAIRCAERAAAGSMSEETAGAAGSNAAALRAALARLEAQRWQPIETAPSYVSEIAKNLRVRPGEYRAQAFYVRTDEIWLAWFAPTENRVEAVYGPLTSAPEPSDG